MKPDLYLKVVLTVIAVCLLVICLRELPLASTARAAGREVVEVRIVSTQGDIPVQINDVRANIFIPLTAFGVLAIIGHPEK